MNGRFSKAWTRRSHVELSKASNIPGVNVCVSGDLGDLLTHHSSAEVLPRSYQEQSLKSGGLAGNTTPLQARLDATPESDPLPVNRARLSRTDARQLVFEDGKAEQTDKV
jgi:hypothetical protein